MNETVKTVTIRPNKPWFNSSIRKSMRLRDRLHKRLKRKYSVSLLGKYRAQRNKVNNMVKGKLRKKNIFLYVFPDV